MALRDWLRWHLEVLSAAALLLPIAAPFLRCHWSCMCIPKALGMIGYLSNVLPGRKACRRGAPEVSDGLRGKA